MIKIENIVKTFNAHSRNKNQVLKGVSFDLPEKGLVAIFGKSGSGKTTLLNIIGGLDRQDSGRIIIDGEDTKGKVDKIRNQKIGFIFQNYYLEKGYTIAQIMQNAMLLAGFKDQKEIAKRSKEVLELVDMDRYKNKQGDALSGGQKQRVAIARALIKGADIILADEPTGNLDAENTIKVMDILKEISKTKLVVLVTHEITLIKNYADSYIQVVDGQLTGDSVIGEVVEYETEQNKIYVDKKKAKKLNTGKLEIEVFGEEIKDKETLQIVSDKGTIYIKPGKNVTIVDDSSEKKIVFSTKEESKQRETKKLPDFEKSQAKHNGRLFDFKKVFKLWRGNKEERFYSTANIFKQIFIAVIAVIVCMFCMTGFEVLNTTVDNKYLGENSVYVNMNTYSDLRTLDRSLYGTIDFFETQYKEGSFSYNGLASLSGIKQNYAPKAIESSDSENTLGLISGQMPQDGEVLITRNLAESLKSQFRLEELNSDKAMLLIEFEEEYKVSGIVEGSYPYVYMNKVDYINFLGVYDSVSLSDYNNLILAEDYKDATFTSEILLVDDSVNLADNEARIEINRNSLYKMMSDTTQADYTINKANTYLASTQGTSTAIQITGSKPIYVQRFEITRDIMTTDIRIYVNQNAIDNIFVYLEPNLDSLEGSVSSLGIESEFYFEINTEDSQQLSMLKEKLTQRGISLVDVKAIFERENAQLIDEASSNLLVFGIIILLLLLIYYFIEKSGSIKNSKEYGIYRAIGVNKSNLLYKECINTVINNLIGYLIFYLLASALLCIRYAVMNVEFGVFLGMLAGAFALSAVMLLAISLIPYLFVLTRTPSQILSRFDI